MDDKQQITIEQLTKVKRELNAKLDKLMRPVNEVREQLDAITKSIAVLLRSDTPSTEDTVAGFPLYRIQGKTQIAAIYEIADYNGGTIDARDVKDILVKSSLMRNTKNTSQMVNLLITRSGAFERIGHAKYRLIQSGQKSRSGAERLFEVTLPPSKPVQ